MSAKPIPFLMSLLCCHHSSTECKQNTFSFFSFPSLFVEKTLLWWHCCQIVDSVVICFGIVLKMLVTILSVLKNYTTLFQTKQITAVQFMHQVSVSTFLGKTAYFHSHGIFCVSENLVQCVTYIYEKTTPQNVSCRLSGNYQDFMYGNELKEIGEKNPTYCTKEEEPSYILNT